MVDVESVPARCNDPPSSPVSSTHENDRLRISENVLSISEGVHVNCYYLREGVYREIKVNPQTDLTDLNYMWPFATYHPFVAVLVIISMQGVFNYIVHVYRLWDATMCHDRPVINRIRAAVITGFEPPTPLVWGVSTGVLQHEFRSDIEWIGYLINSLGW